MKGQTLEARAGKPRPYGPISNWFIHQDKPFGLSQDEPFGFAQDEPCGLPQDKRQVDSVPCYPAVPEALPQGDVAASAGDDSHHRLAQRGAQG